MLNLLCKILIVGLSLGLAHFAAEAAQVEKVKNKSVLVNLEGETANMGDVYYVVDPTGKKRGLIKIRKVSRGRAIAVLGKGTAEPGWMLELKPLPARRPTPKQGPSDFAAKGSASSSRAFWGVIGGLSMNTVDVELVNDATGQPTGETVNLTGYGPILKGLFDYKVFDSLWFRGGAGLESLTAEGSRANGETRDVNISYLGFDFWGRFVFSSGNFVPWAGLGVSLMFPMSKSSSALKEGSITNTSTYGLGGGFDIKLASGNYIPVQFEYGLYPESSLVSASFMALKVGYAMPW